MMRCVVVGSGVSGMTAALLLAGNGHDVTLLEAGDRPSPLLRGFSREGLVFDTGFHSAGGIHAGGTLHRWLRALDLAPLLHGVSTSHTDVFLFSDGRRFCLPAGKDDILNAVDGQFPGQAPAMERFMEVLNGCFAHSAYLDPSVRGEPESFADNTENLASFLDQFPFPPHLRAMVSCRCLLYGVPPAVASRRDYALVAGPYFHSCGTWDGGGLALAEAFLKKLSRKGVIPRCNCAITQIEGTKSRGVTGVSLHDGSRIPCEACFFTGHPAQLEKLLPPGLLRPAFYRRIREMPETPSAILLFAETRDALCEQESLYILPKPDSPDIFQEMETSSVYIHCGRPAADGRKAVMAVAFLPPRALPEGDPQPRPESYRIWKKETMLRLKSYVETRMPALKGRWRILDAATSLSLRHWIHGSTGSLYGIRHEAANMPLLPVTRLQGLFLAGQNIVLPGILGAIVSGALAAGFALGHDAALKEFRQCAGDG